MDDKFYGSIEEGDTWKPSRSDRGLKPRITSFSSNFGRITKIVCCIFQTRFLVMILTCTFGGERTCWRKCEIEASPSFPSLPAMIDRSSSLLREGGKEGRRGGRWW